MPSIDENYKYVKELNMDIIEYISKYDGVHINSTDNSIPYIINFSVKGIKPETFIHAMEEYDIYISTRSACSTSDISRAVDSIYHDNEIAGHSIRISLSYKNTMEEVEKFKAAFDIVYNKLLLK